MLYLDLHGLTLSELDLVSEKYVLHCGKILWDFLTQNNKKSETHEINPQDESGSVFLFSSFV